MEDFDEYEYLEKTVEETNRSGDREKAVEEKKRRSSGDREKERRRRDRDDDYDNVSRRNSGRRSHDRHDDNVDRRGSGRRSHDRHDDNVDRRSSGRRSQDRYRDEDRDRRDRKRRRSSDREAEADQARENRRPNRAAAKKEELAEPEADPERDQKTVFAFQLPIKANERDIYDFFSHAGKVRDVRLIMDRNSRRSKGFAYVEFFEAFSVPMAIALSGQPILGQPVLVKPSEAEKNLVQTSASSTSANNQDRKLYVENLHYNFTELQLRQIFDPFGQLELVQLPTHPETGHSKGYGFVQFVLLECAQAAKSGLNGFEIAGRTIKVSEYYPGARDSDQFDNVDDEDGAGKLTLNAQSRASLMAKLDRSGMGMTTITMPIVGPTMSMPPAVLATQEPVGIPSQCLLLRNMFDAAGLDDAGFEEIKDDVGDECSRFGAVEHVYVDRNSRGCVYLRFDSVDAAARAQQAMHNRWFACRQISAIYLQSYEYEAKFKGLING